MLLAIIKNLAYFLLALFGIGWLINFIAISFFNYQEEKIYKEWKNEADRIKSQPIGLPVMNLQLKVLEEKYQPIISRLERKRQYLRDIMRLIKK